MGFRFRRSIKIAPGVRLNVSKSGISATIGPRGAKLTIGDGRVRTTVGLPGTGLSYTGSSKLNGAPRTTTARASAPTYAIPRAQLTSQAAQVPQPPPRPKYGLHILAGFLVVLGLASASNSDRPQAIMLFGFAALAFPPSLALLRACIPVLRTGWAVAAAAIAVFAAGSGADALYKASLARHTQAVANQQAVNAAAAKEAKRRAFTARKTQLLQDIQAQLDAQQPERALAFAQPYLELGDPDVAHLTRSATADVARKALYVSPAPAVPEQRRLLDVIAENGYLTAQEKNRRYALDYRFSDPQAKIRAVQTLMGQGLDKKIKAAIRTSGGRVQEEWAEFVSYFDKPGPGDRVTVLVHVHNDRTSEARYASLDVTADGDILSVNLER